MAFRGFAIQACAAALLLSSASPAWSAPSVPPVGATLTVLDSPVTVGRGGDATVRPASDGELLGTGDVVRTGATGLALLTFFDGSEVQLSRDTEVRLDSVNRSGNGVSLFQAAGTTVQRIAQNGNAGTFETSSPTSIGLVRGTTYVVSVERLPTLTEFYPRALSNRPGFFLTAERTVREGRDLVHYRTWREAASGTTTELREVLGAFDLQKEALYAERGNVWRVRSWQDPATGSTWDTFEELGPERQDVPGRDFAACKVGDQRCVTTTVLLPDPDGSTGKLDVQSRIPLPAQQLESACGVSAAGGDGILQATVATPTCAEWQATSRDLRDTSRARQLRAEADGISRESALMLGMPVLPPPAASTPRLQSPSTLHLGLIQLALGAGGGSALLVAAGLAGWGVIRFQKGQRQARAEELVRIGRLRND